jgi:hypothetical protein
MVQILQLNFIPLSYQGKYPGIVLLEIRPNAQSQSTTC